MSDTRRWVKNRKTGLVFPVNPSMFSSGVIDPDLVPCAGPQDETPVRPIIPGLPGVDMTKWIDPDSVASTPVVDDVEDVESAIPTERIEFQPEPEVVEVEESVDVSAEEIDLDAEHVAAIATPETAPETAPQQGSPSHEQLVLEAIATLDTADNSHWTKGGLPDARVLTEKCGFQVTKDLRDRCWEQFKAAQPK